MLIIHNLEWLYFSHWFYLYAVMYVSIHIGMQDKCNVIPIKMILSAVSIGFELWLLICWMVLGMRGEEKAKLNTGWIKLQSYYEFRIIGQDKHCL